MILISTLRKMIQKDPTATVARLVVKAHQVNLGERVIDVPEYSDFFATERQVNEANIKFAEQITLFGNDPAKLIFVDFVPANDAAKAQGFDYLQARV